MKCNYFVYWLKENLDKLSFKISQTSKINFKIQTILTYIDTYRLCVNKI